MWHYKTKSLPWTFYFDLFYQLKQSQPPCMEHASRTTVRLLLIIVVVKCWHEHGVNYSEWLIYVLYLIKCFWFTLSHHVYLIYKSHLIIHIMYIIYLIMYFTLHSQISSYTSHLHDLSYTSFTKQCWSYSLFHHILLIGMIYLILHSQNHVHRNSLLSSPLWWNHSSNQNEQNFKLMIWCVVGGCKLLTQNLRFSWQNMLAKQMIWKVHVQRKNTIGWMPYHRTKPAPNSMFSWALHSLYTQTAIWNYVPLETD